MPSLRKDVDPEGLLEYSVVYSDRALNHMSKSFQQIMKDIFQTLCKVYQAEATVVVPGSGTFAMESVARQFASGERCLVIRNGWFSYRWSQIFEMGQIPGQSIVMKARQQGKSDHAPFIPAPIEEVIAMIETEKPRVVFAPHVETSSGMMLPSSYLQQISQAVHNVGGLFVLDCIASGTVWVDMKKDGVDILISAPQKGWSAHPCCGLVMLSERALSNLPQTKSSSFACDLKKWWEIMQAYLNGGHAYHATMPTEGLRQFHKIMFEMEAFGFDQACTNQLELGSKIRQLLTQHGFQSVAEKGFQAPGVVVCYTNDASIKSGKRFADQGIQIAAGVPLQCDEPANFQSFRIGLFGLDKLQNVDQTVKRFQEALANF